MQRVVVLMLLMSSCVWGQQPAPAPMGGMDMSGMDHSQMPGMKMQPGGEMSELMVQMKPKTFLQQIRRHGSSGTSAEPNATPMPMLMTMKGEWMLMFHANVFVNDTQQTSARGGDKLFSTNWLMPMAERMVGPGQLTVRAMFSLEPATITGRQYPLPFQQGETAFGKPIVDGQHPHDFFMELAALYDWKLGQRTLLSFYAAPIGDPALGPEAYPHRASARENPVGALGHHQQDSTHIASDVVTLGLAHRSVRLEVSGFHGREPDELRWNIDQGAIDSWSTRLTVQPGQRWSGQYSYGRIKSPEAQSPAEDQARMTASVMYNRAFRGGNWASTALWGRTRALPDNSKENSYLLESTLRFAVRNRVWTRVENAGRSDELLGSGHGHEEPLTHVQAYTLGYDRDFDMVPHLASALGVQVTGYGVGAPLVGTYGAHPVGVNVFLRLRPFSGEAR